MPMKGEALVCHLQASSDKVAQYILKDKSLGVLNHTIFICF